jgi:hypothetical protein
LSTGIFEAKSAKGWSYLLKDAVFLEGELEKNL